jgi:hypothetical protein
MEQNESVVLTAKQQIIEQRYGKPWLEVVTERYDALGSWEAVAKELGVTRYLLYLWLKAVGYQTRKTVGKS